MLAIVMPRPGDVGASLLGSCPGGLPGKGSSERKSRSGLRLGVCGYHVEASPLVARTTPRRGAESRGLVGGSDRRWTLTRRMRAASDSAASSPWRGEESSASARRCDSRPTPLRRGPPNERRYGDERVPGDKA